MSSQSSRELIRVPLYVKLGAFFVALETVVALVGLRRAAATVEAGDMGEDGQTEDGRSGDPA